MASYSVITQDSTCIIVYQQNDIVFYYNWISDDQWIIWGKCNLCGLCIEGVENADIRPKEERLDIPMRPPIKIKECSLRGVHI